MMFFPGIDLDKFKPVVPVWKSPAVRKDEELQDAKDTLDRLWVLIEFDGRIPEEILDEVDQIIQAYRYGTTVASTKVSNSDKAVFDQLKSEGGGRWSSSAN